MTQTQPQQPPPVAEDVQTRESGTTVYMPFTDPEEEREWDEIMIQRGFEV